MRKSSISIVIVLILNSYALIAETVNLVNGKVICGEVIELSEKKIIVQKANGQRLNFKSEEVKSIEFGDSCTPKIALAITPGLNVKKPDQKARLGLRAPAKSSWLADYVFNESFQNFRTAFVTGSIIFRESVRENSRFAALQTV